MIAAAFGMAQNHAGCPHILHHGGADVSGMGSILKGGNILGAQHNRCSPQKVTGQKQIRKRNTYHHADMVKGGHQRNQALAKGPKRPNIALHFPIGGDPHRGHVYCERHRVARGSAIMDQEGAPFFYNPEKNFMAHEKDTYRIFVPSPDFPLNFWKRISLKL